MKQFRHAQIVLIYNLRNYINPYDFSLRDNSLLEIGREVRDYGGDVGEELLVDEREVEAVVGDHELVDLVGGLYVLGGGEDGFEGDEGVERIGRGEVVERDDGVDGGPLGLEGGELEGGVGGIELERHWREIGMYYKRW